MLSQREGCELTVTIFVIAAPKLPGRNHKLTLSGALSKLGCVIDMILHVRTCSAIHAHQQLMLLGFSCAVVPLYDCVSLLPLEYDDAGQEDTGADQNDNAGDSEHKHV